MINTMLKRSLVSIAVSSSLLCFGLIFVVAFVNAVEVNCTRGDDRLYSCHLQTLLFGRFPIRERTVDNIRNVVMAESCDEDGCSYRTEFVITDDEQIPVTHVWTNRGPVREQTEALKTQILQGKEVFSYTITPQWWVIWLFVGFGFVFLFISGFSGFRWRT